MAEDETDETPKKKRGLLVPLLVGVILAGAAGGGGYWAVTQGPLAGDDSGGEHAAEADGHDDGHGADTTYSGPVDVAFVPLETVVITLGPELAGRHLIFTGELEVDPDYESEVTRLAPRVLDVLNSYLRVIDLSELSDPTSLARLRAQMLRRIQVVTGSGRVRDLLVTQFVVN